MTKQEILQLQQRFTDAQKEAEYALRKRKICMKRMRCTGNCASCPVTIEAITKKRAFTEIRRTLMQRNQQLIEAAEQRLISRVMKDDVPSTYRTEAALTCEMYNEYWREGKSASQIARLLGISPSSVTRHKQKWLKKGLLVEGEKQNE